MSNFKKLNTITQLSLLCIAFLLGGCGHLVTGYSSLPYLENHPTHLNDAVNTGIPKSELVTLDAKVTVNLWNEVYTSAPEAKAFNQSTPGNYMMLLQITPQREGLSFDPRAVKLSIDDKKYSVKAYDGSETDMRINLPTGKLRKFSAWDDQKKSEDETERYVPMLLTNGCFYTLTLQFDTPKPSPDNQITLDLSLALKDQNGGMPDRILFQKVFWQEMHQ